MPFGEKYSAAFFPLPDGCPLAHFSHRSPIVLPSFSHLKWENDGRTMGERWEKYPTIYLPDR
ncbi:MAG: hypothetical protein ACSW8I_00855 [bacterium]